MSKWTPERLKKDKESWEAKNNSRTTNRTASTGTAAGTANTTDKWTPERIAKARESWEAKSSGQNAASPAAAARQNTGISGQKRHCDRQRYRYTQQHCAAGMAEREEHCSSGGKGDGNGAAH